MPGVKNAKMLPTFIHIFTWTMQFIKQKLFWVNTIYNIFSKMNVILKEIESRPLNMETTGLLGMKQS